MLIAPKLTANIWKVARAYAKARNMELSTIGQLALQNARFFARLEASEAEDPPRHKYWAETYDALMLWFSSNWPEGLAWPKDVPRPRQQSASAA